ncbi:S-layer homology domain-containing protein [Lawsonibacter sp. JLR.KK007]|uniref:S-layer homology domain-containing protein n=1 Tax=Lawsonibacter sp. JLR.KK007 TaxID=3114293 RepID=UPI002FF378A1
MRNLKRALSLTLASVMLLGMMVVGSSAAGYPDVAEDDNVEAIEVVQSVGVMVGDENGNFRPGDSVSRAEMAVVMGKLLNLDYNYYEAVCPFTDVAGVYDWARGWVGAAAANGIVSGRGDGIYDPAATVTAVEAASMMMRALGYFKYQNDYADGFEVSTVRLGTTIGIFDGVGSSATEPMTRNQVAQMVLNALQSAVVEPDGNTINLTTPDGTVYTGKVNYVSVTSARSFATAISRTQATSVGSQNDGWIVELGERLYDGKLELRDNTQDDFGRPSRTWMFDGSEIGTYVKRELLVKDYTVGVKGREIYELLSQTTIRDNTLRTYFDGANNTIVKNDLVRSNESNLANTGRGILTEVYLDIENDQFFIVSINTWLAQASVDYNANSETITLTIYNGENGSSISKRVDVEDAPYIANMKKDDWCLVQWADASAAHTAKEIVRVFDVEIIEDQELTGFSRSNVEYSSTGTGRVGRVTGITYNGETIQNNQQAWYKFNTLNDFDANELVNKTYTVYMDQYGYFIGAELYSGNNQYVFITGYDRDGSHLSVNTVKANGIFTDGTMAAIDVNCKDTDDNIKAYNVSNEVIAGITSAGYTAAYEQANVANLDYIRWSTRSTNTGVGAGDGGYALENMWYKYTLNNGVYTLTPVDGWTLDVKQTAGDREVNSSNIYLSNSEDAQDRGTNRSFGEDASIYITVDDGDVDLPNGGRAITEVTGLYTGVQDVNLVIPQGKWIHAVYEDNYIVAAIVYGEAEGIVDNYAYIRDGIEREWKETDESGNVTHFWEFPAVMNGELTTRTVKSRFSNTISSLKPGTVQELVLDADGYVTRIKDVENDNGNVNPNEDNNLYDNYDYAQKVVTLKGYDVYHLLTAKNAWVEGTMAMVTNTAMPNTRVLSNGVLATDLAFKGNTLRYTANEENGNIGLPVARDAKAVVYQRINGKDSWENYATVNAAYSILNDADYDSSNNLDGNKQFAGEIIAVLNSNGVAEWVVFIDNTETLGTSTTYPETRMALTNNGNGISTLTVNGEARSTATGTVVIPAGSTIVMTVKSGFTPTISGGAGVTHTTGSDTWTIIAPALGNTVTIRVTKDAIVGERTIDIYDANVLLADAAEGDEVVIRAENSSWVPTDSATNTLNIPAGKTLHIVGGSLNASTWNNDITGTGTLIVDRQYTTKAGANITYTVTARDLTLSAASGSATTTNIGKNVTVSNNMTVATASSQTHTVNIASGATVNVGTSLTRGGSDTAVINVNGTLVVAETNTTTNTTIGNVTINVHSANTLRAGGVLSNVILNIGDASNAGRAIIRSMNGGTLALVNGSLVVNAGAELAPAAVTKTSVVSGFTVTIASGVTTNLAVKDSITGTSGAADDAGTYTAGGTANESTFTQSNPAAPVETAEDLAGLVTLPSKNAAADTWLAPIAEYAATGLTVTAEAGEGKVVNISIKGTIVTPESISDEALIAYTGFSTAEEAKTQWAADDHWGIGEDTKWGFVLYNTVQNNNGEIGEMLRCVLVKWNSTNSKWEAAGAWDSSQSKIPFANERTYESGTKTLKVTFDMTAPTA